MMYPFVDMEEDNTEAESGSDIPREYGIDFETGQLTGKIVEGIEAIKVWAWLALQTPRYRCYVYSWDYGNEYEDLIGQGYSEEYTQMELYRMTEECLLQNDYITGIDNFECKRQGDHITISFTMNTTIGDAEVETVV